MQDSIVRFENVSMQFPGVLANDRVSFDIKKGEVFALVGENGAGKSTLGAVLTGRPGYEVTSGSVVYDGRDLLSMSPEDHDRWQALGDEILFALTAAVRAGEVPAGAEGLRIAELHRQWLSFSWANYTPQAHAGVAQMYVADSRFTAYYDKEQPGCATFLRDAVLAYSAAQ